jgi:hypothetical protein
MRPTQRATPRTVHAVAPNENQRWLQGWATFKYTVEQGPAPAIVAIEAPIVQHSLGVEAPHGCCRCWRSGQPSGYRYELGVLNSEPPLGDDKKRE